MGKQQLFDLGQYIRNRYAGFLKPTYSEDDIYVQASNVTRTKLSARAFLLGLYKPETRPDFLSNNSPWDPSFTVHTIPTNNDHLIRNSMKCDAFTQHLDKFKRTAEIKEFNREHQELYDYLTVHSGNDVEQMSDAVHIRDTLMIEGIHNRR